jgi:hypothetical protein
MGVCGIDYVLFPAAYCHYQLEYCSKPITSTRKYFCLFAACLRRIKSRPLKWQRRQVGEPAAGRRAECVRLPTEPQSRRSGDKPGL